MDVVYYTCLNGDCELYRGIFIEGDPQHENCERASLFPEEPAARPAWTWALPVALALAVGAAAFVYMRRRARSDAQSHKPPMGEHRTETWSGIDRHPAERKSHSAPPPVGPERYLE